MILFEMNVRLQRKPLDRIAEEHLGRLAALGFDWIWLMGVWRIGPSVVAFSKQHAPDFEGSPYAIETYEVSPELGGDAALRRFVERAHHAGLRVMVDFVPNHMGMDSPIIDAHPEFVIHSNASHRDETATDYFEHRVGRLAHGKDPHFAGWTDTVQLDYAHPGLRAHQIEALQRISSMVDGVRCDMAMLVLRDQVKKQWFPRVDQGLFDRHFPREFWPEAISAVKQRFPDFVFMAEVYWDKEPYLQELGFDLTYDKKLYDLLAHASAEEVSGYLERAPSEVLARSVHFLENHDEDRAAVRFGVRERPAAILSFALPGAVFVHEGQMEGFTEKLPVQRIRPRTIEVPDTQLSAFFATLLARVKDPIFAEGEMVSLGVQHGVILILRRHQGRVVLVGANPTGARLRQSPVIALARDRLGIARGVDLHGGDLWSGATLEIGGAPDQVKLREGAVQSFPDNQGFLIELSWSSAR